MPKTTLYIPDHDFRLLRRTAAETGRTLTSLIQEAVRRLLRAPKPFSAPRQFLAARGLSRKSNPFGDAVQYQRELRSEWRRESAS